MRRRRIASGFTIWVSFFPGSRVTKKAVLRHDAMGIRGWVERENLAKDILRYLRLISIATAACLISGCFSQVPLSSWSSPLPTSSPLYPMVVTTGDILEVRYYLEARVQKALYQLGVGDVIRVEVDGYPELSREQIEILPDGTVSLPVIGTINIAGQSTSDASRFIATRYTQYQVKDPIVVVSVMEGQQRLKRLLESRRFQAEGDTFVIPVYQGVPISLPFIGVVAVDRPLEEIQEDIAARYAKEFGTQLNVVVNLRQREVPTASVMGEVKVPGRINMSQALTPMGAIAAAGGYTEVADPERVAVIRFSPGGSYQRWIFNMREDVNDANAAQHNFTLAKNDVVVVIRTGVADLNLAIAQYIRNNIPVTSYFGATIPIGP